MNDEERSELENLRKLKMKVLAEQVVSNMTHTGEHLDKTLQAIEDLKEIQEKRIEAFRKLFEVKE